MARYGRLSLIIRSFICVITLSFRRIYSPGDAALYKQTITITQINENPRAKREKAPEA